MEEEWALVARVAETVAAKGEAEREEATGAEARVEAGMAVAKAAEATVEVVMVAATAEEERVVAARVVVARAAAARVVAVGVEAVTAAVHLEGAVASEDSLLEALEGSVVVVARGG